MKFLYFALAGLTLSASAATAADLPSRRAPPVFVEAAPPVFSWTGFYIGANAGYAFDAGTSSAIVGNDAGLQTVINAGIRPGFGSIKRSGFTGGGQIGYNYQLGNGLFGGAGGGGLVIGVEADAAYTDVRGSAVYFSNRESDFSTRTSFVGTARGRLGYAFDQVLVYGTGGFAYGDVSNTASFLNGVGQQIYQGGASSIRTGYVYGGGVEFAIPTTSVFNLFHSSAVTFKVEYLRYDLGTRTIQISNNAGVDPGYTQTVRTNGNLVRAGINYKFDSVVAAPVVARY
jgi:outer membrane immunogenic protein